jgi:hypothetical protein
MTASNLALWAFVILSVIILAFAALILGKMWKGTVSLDGLLTEPGPAGEPVKASLARFQFLLFSFVIAGLFLLLSIEAGTFVDIPTNVLALLGISGGSYVLSKSVSPGGALNRSDGDTKNTDKPKGEK